MAIPTTSKKPSLQDDSIDPRVVAREAAAYKSDEEIQAYLFFRLCAWFWGWYGSLMYKFEIQGWENVPKDRPALFVSLHTFQSADIPMCLSGASVKTGRVVRGLFHRPFMRIFYWLLSPLGAVGGRRQTAVQMLKRGCWMAVIPGGAEEFLFHNTQNGKHAYEVLWVSNGGKRRNGVGAVAVEMGPGFQAFPCFCENGEEMRFNLIVELWTFLRLDSAYSYLTGLLPKPLHWLFYQVGLWLSGFACLVGIPVPVKVTQHIGEAVEVERGESAEAFSRRVEAQLQALIDSRMRGRRHRSYWEGMKARFARGGRLEQGTRHAAAEAKRR